MWVCGTRRHAGVVAVFRCVLLAAGAWTLGCGGGGVSPVAPPPPPPPPTITVTVSPPTGAVLYTCELKVRETSGGLSRYCEMWTDTLKRAEAEYTDEAFQA